MLSGSPVKLLLLAGSVIFLFVLFVIIELPSQASHDPSINSAPCPGRYSDPSRVARIAFGADEPLIPLEVVRAKTDPPFLQACVPSKDDCKNYPGIILAEHGFFAPVETTIFHKILKTGCKKLDAQGRPPLVVDVGGNIGYFTNYAAVMGCRVVTFEPIPRIARFLNFSIMINDIRQRVEVHQAAASDKNGRSNIHFNCGDSGQSQIQKDGSGDVTIRLVRLDEIVKEDVLLLKIDTEGYEDAVLRGAKGLFENYKVDNIVCETKKINDIDFKVQFMNDLLAKGYKVFSYFEHYNIDQNAWKNKVKEDVDMSDFRRIREVNAKDWIPAEDLWYIREDDTH